MALRAWAAAGPYPGVDPLYGRSYPYLDDSLYRRAALDAKLRSSVLDDPLYRRSALDYPLRSSLLDDGLYGYRAGIVGRSAYDAATTTAIAAAAATQAAEAGYLGG